MFVEFDHPIETRQFAKTRVIISVTVKKILPISYYHQERLKGHTSAGALLWEIHKGTESLLAMNR